jgi:hypothetical protein
MIMEERRETLNNAIQQNTQLSVQNVELMEVNREYSRQSIGPEAAYTNTFDMTHSECDCCGATEHDNFLVTSRSNFQTHTDLFPHGDPDKVKYVGRHLSTWNNQPHPAHRQTLNTDLVVWLPDLRRDSDHCVEDFEAFSEEMQNIYGDKVRKLNTAPKSMTAFF